MTAIQPIGLLPLGGDIRRAEALAMRLNLPMVNAQDSATFRLLLGYLDDRQLGLAFTDDFSPRNPPVTNSTVWFSPSLKPRGTAPGRDPLLRAIGYKTTTLIDCTAGWGVDAVHCAAHGMTVDAIEKHPLVFELLDQANQSAISAINERGSLRLHYGHALDFLADPDVSAEVIYLDPMYPPKRGSAAPKRPLQLLQALHGGNTLISDPADLLALARQRATKRVVVKRPHYAPALGAGCSGSVDARLVRFDLYPPLNG